MGDADGCAHVDLAALAQVKLLLEIGHCFPSHCPVPLATGADGAADAHDVGVDARQFVQVVQFQVAAESRAESGRLGLHDHIPEHRLGHEVE